MPPRRLAEIATPKHFSAAEWRRLAFIMRPGDIYLTINGFHEEYMALIQHMHPLYEHWWEVPENLRYEKVLEQYEIIGDVHGFNRTMVSGSVAFARRALEIDRALDQFFANLRNQGYRHIPPRLSTRVVALMENGQKLLEINRTLRDNFKAHYIIRDPRTIRECLRGYASNLEDEIGRLFMRNEFLNSGASTTALLTSATIDTTHPSDPMVIQGVCGVRCSEVCLDTPEDQKQACYSMCSSEAHLICADCITDILSSKRGSSPFLTQGGLQETKCLGLHCDRSLSDAFWGFIRIKKAKAKSELAETKPASISMISQDPIASGGINIAVQESSRKDDSNTILNTINMQIIGGFIAVLGIAAVAIAFTSLNASTLGVAGLVVGGIGLASILLGCTFFKSGYDLRNSNKAPHDFAVPGNTI